MKKVFTSSLLYRSCWLLGFTISLLISSTQQSNAQCNVGGGGAITAPTTCTGGSVALGAGEYRTMAFAAGVVYNFTYSDNAQSSGMCINGIRYTAGTNFTPGGTTWNVGMWRANGTWTTSSATLTYKLVTPTLTTAGGGTVCSSTNVTASATNGTAYWQGTACGTSTGTPSTSQSVSSSNTYYYNVNNGGCWSGCSSQAVTINTPSTKPTGISGTISLCNGVGTTLTATGGSVGTGATYQWGTGNVVGTSPIGGATASTYSVTPSSTTNYWVSVTGPAPCGSPSGGATTTVTVSNPSFAVTGISGTTSVCNGVGTTLTATGGTLGTGATYQWGTGNVVGTSPIGGATASTYSVTPSSTTNYWVSITGPAPCGGAGGTYVPVTVSNPSSAVTGISGTTSLCNGVGTTLTATGGTLGTGATYQWGTGNVVGTSPIGGATASTYSVTPSSTTSYWVSITGPAPCGGAGGVSTAVTVSNPSSAVTGISGTTTLCNGVGTTLTATGGTLGTGATYQWGIGNVVGTSPVGGATASTYSVTPSSTTSYWVSITGPAPCGGAGGVSTAVTVSNPSSAVTGISGTTTVCQGTGTTLTATGGTLGTGATYQWGIGNVVGTSPVGGATASTYSVTPSSTTSYWVSITGPAPCGGAGGVSTSVTMNPIPVPTFTTAPSSPQCNYTTVTYTTQPGNTNYIWSGLGSAGTDYNIISGGISTSDNTVTLQWVSTGTKLVRVTYTALGCPAFTQASSSIVVNGRPSTPAISTSGTFCTGNNITYSTTTGQSNYIWTVVTGILGTDYNVISGGSSTDDNIKVKWLTGGSKTVTVNFTNGSGCTALTSGTNSTTVSVAPTSAVVADVIDGCNGGHTATVTITGGTSPYDFTLCSTNFTGVTSPYALDAGANTTCTLSSVQDAAGCVPSTISGSPVTYPSRALTTGGTTSCMVNTSATKIFYDNSGNLMVKLTDGGATLGNTTVIATIDGSVQSFGPTNPQSYLQRHFKISPTNQSGAASVCLYLSDAEVAALNTASAGDNHSAPSYYPTFQTTLSNAVVTKFHGAGETPSSNTSRQVLTPGTKTHNPTVNGVVYNNVWEVCMNVTTWSGFYVHGQNVNNTPLPVTMLYLTADAIDNKYIQLDWATATEINNSGFQVERSTDGINFMGIGWIAGHGTTNEMITYQYSDRTAQPGTVYYYRLKQVDTDGQSQYTETVSASLISDKGFVFEDLIPNPADNYVQLGILTTSGQKATVTITDMLGRTVLTEPWQLSEGYNLSKYDISGLAGGAYSVTVYAGTTYTTKRLVVAK